MEDHNRLEELLARSGQGPLSGTIIADFGRVLAGPYCTMLLADMGATVIKVESPIGDETRAWMPPEHEGKSTYYLSINRNKLSIELDFSDPGDLATARELAARADVVIENFKPGGLEKFGLDYQSVRYRGRGEPSWIRPARPGCLRAHESHRGAGDRAVPCRRRGRRCVHGYARLHRYLRRPQPPASDR